MALNHAHFDAMGALRNGFEGYRQDHERMIKEEMQVLKEEMEMKEQFRRNGLDASTYEREIEGVNSYLDRM